jgi:hypothetical protein
MRLLYTGIICVACVVLVGCSEEQAANRTEKNLDAELVNTLNNIGVENAIIAQHTLYPYHFVADGAGLNDLGRRDLMVLAKHFKENPGVLNIRKGEAGAALYEARVARVLSQLKEAGVETDRTSVSDGMPGGDGVPSERVVTVFQKKSESSTSMRSGSSTSGTLTR